MKQFQERNEPNSEAENGEQEGVGMVSDSLISEVNRNVKKAEIAMVKSNLAKHPPNKYNPGEIVSVKSDAVGAGIKRKRLSLTKSSSSSRTKRFRVHFESVNWTSW
ncbi:hypothetical protein BaRGS_00001057 [Batillaria attramentaria]|uniref:Uncharacterized protein n=1 Tax=Batillaria attramentaria TaxID=370345 RepID=A0ABD0M644_9CAEN